MIRSTNSTDKFLPLWSRTYSELRKIYCLFHVVIIYVPALHHKTEQKSGWDNYERRGYMLASMRKLSSNVSECNPPMLNNINCAIYNMRSMGMGWIGSLVKGITTSTGKHAWSTGRLFFWHLKKLNRLTIYIFITR